MENKSNSKRRISIALKLNGIVTVIVLVLSITIPVIVFLQFGQFYKENLANEALNLARTLAASIEASYSEGYITNATKEENNHLMDVLQTTIDETKLKHIYILKENDNGSFAYIADAAGVLGHDGPVNMLGDIRPKDTCSKELLSVFETGTSVAENHITRSKSLGDSIGAYAPIYFGEELAAIVAVDIYALNFYSLIGRYVLTTSIILLAGNIVASFIYYTFVRKVVVNPINSIKYAAEQIANRNFNFVLDVKNNDEIGDVAAVINHDVVPAFEELKEKNIRIEESMSYASKIQRNILPDESLMSQVLKEHYVWWKPKEQVGGDLYWVGLYKDRAVLVVGDCTGHAVSGAMMTMTVNAILSQVVTEETCMHPDVIISSLDKKLSAITGAATSADAVSDGLDAVVLCIDADRNIELSATNLSVLVRNGSSTQTIKGQRSAIGEGKISGPEMIKKYSIQYREDNMYFIATDGLTDQIGWQTHLPFGNARLKRTMDSFGSIPVREAIEIIMAKFTDYKGSEPQRDDVTMIGFKL